MVPAPTGRIRRSIPIQPGERSADIALAATLRRFVLRQLQAPSSRASCLRLERTDLQKNLRFRPSGPLIVFLLDTSDSMGEGILTRMKAAKGAVMAILRQASLSRSRVALVTFGGDHAEVVLAPTNSVGLARLRLEKLPAGGATPFAEGLWKTWQLIRSDRLKHRGSHPLIIIVSDGEANVPLSAGQPVWAELLELAAGIRRDHIPSVVIDIVADPVKQTTLPELAQRLGASYARVRHLRAAAILQLVQRQQA